MVHVAIQAVLGIVTALSISTVAQVNELPSTEALDVPITATAQETTRDAIIEEASLTFGLEAELIKSVIFHESGGDANAMSYCGAVGLMQIMPQYCIAYLEKYDNKNLNDERTNIMIGCEMLAEHINKYGTYLGLTAYNAGEYSQAFEEVQAGATWEYAEKIILYAESLKNG